MTIQEQIRQYIAENFMFAVPSTSSVVATSVGLTAASSAGNDGYQLSDDASFLEEGIVDSTGVLELVLFVEETFQVTVEDQEIVPENFDSVNKLAAYIQRKASRDLTAR